MERRPHSVFPVMGSIGMRRRNFSFFPPTSTPSTSVCKIGRISLGTDFDLEGAAIGSVFVAVDGVAHGPERTPQVAFLLALDHHSRQGQRHAGEDHQDGGGHDELYQRETGRLG